MRRTLAALLLTACAAPAAADPPKLPDAAKAAPGDLVTFSVKGKDVGYHPAFDKSKALLVRLYTDEPDTLSFLFQAKEPGDYTVAFWTAGEKTGASFTVQVRAPEPPKPPAPPQPPAPPIDPALRQKLQTAFAADTGDAAAKDEWRKDVVALYRKAVDLARDKSIPTAGALRTRMKAAGASLTNDKLTGVRTVIADVLADAFTDDSLALDDAARQKAADLFLKIAAALDW